MRLLSGVVTVALGVGLAGAMSCGDGATDTTGSLTVVAGNTQSGVAGSTLIVQPSVKAVDGSGKGKAGVVVDFAVATGGGSATAKKATTNADGIATVGSWTLGKTSGANTLTATATGFTGSPVTFTATGVAGPAVSVVTAAGNGQTATVATTLTTAPSVKVGDENLNGVPGVSVTFAVTQGGGSITGATQTTDSLGIAKVGSWTLGPLVGTNALKVTAAGLTSPATIGATGAAGAPTQLVMLTQPAVAVDGTPFATQPSVQVMDANNNFINTSTVNVTASVASGSGTLGGTTTVQAVGGVATFTNLSLTGTGSNNTLKFTSSGLTQATSASVTVAQLNLTIDGLYINQATQAYNGSVPLIAGRAGLLRVFVKSNPNSVAPAVKVDLYKSGAVIQTYTITAPSGSVPTTINEGVLTSSWNVLIPANVMQTGLSILAEVDPTNAISEASDGDNKFPVSGTPLTLDVRAATPFRLMRVPVQQSNGVRADMTATNANTWLDYANRVYPFPSIDDSTHLTYSYTNQGGILSAAYDNTWTQLLSEMLNLHNAEGSTRYYYGGLTPAYSGGGTGLGYIGNPAAIGVDWQPPQTPVVNPSTTYRAMTMAHELGHNFGRQHVNCGGPSGPDLSYPYAATTSIGKYGYDLVYSAQRDSSGNVDFMSYCTPLWISDYTYKAVIDWRASHGNGPTGSTGPTVSQHSLLVWGRIGPSGVILEPSFEVDAPPVLPTEAGPYSVQATDDLGRELFNLSFSGMEIDHLPGERAFSFVVPLPASGARPSTLRLRANGRESVQRQNVFAALAAAGNSTVALGSVRASTANPQRSHVEWDAGTYPMAMVRDPATGQVLAFARGGQIDVAVSPRDLDVTFSDGVTSQRRTIRITPR